MFQVTGKIISKYYREFMMKLLTVIIAIFCLLHGQLPTVYAQDTSSPGADNVEVGDGGSTEDKDPFSMQKPASVETTEENDEETDEEKLAEELQEGGTTISDSSEFKEYNEDVHQIVLQTLILLMIAISAPAFAITCPKAPDVWIHAVAGVLLVVMEGILWGVYEKAGEQALEILEGSQEAYTTQLDSMQLAMDQTLKAKTWMDMRFGMTVGATALIGVAIAVTLIMSIIEVVRSLGAETAKAGSCFSSYNRKGLESGNMFAQQAFTGPPISLNNMADRLSTAKDLGDLAFISQEIEGLRKGAIKSPSVDDYRALNEMEDFSEIIQGTDGIIETLVKQLKSLGDIIVPPAHAFIKAEDMASKLAAIGIGVGAGIISGILIGVKGAFSVSKINGWIRVAFYTVEAALMSWFSVVTDHTRKAYEKRAKAYETLYTKLQGLLAAAPAQGMDGKVAIRPARLIKNNAENGAFAAANKKCTTGGPGVFIPDPNCNCLATKTCKTVKLPSTNFAGFKTPGVISGSAKAGEDMGNNLFNGNLQGAMTNANTLGRNAVKIRGVNEKLKKLANKTLIKYGKKPVDFDKMKRDTANKLTSGVSKSFNSLSKSDQNALIAAVAKKMPTEKVEKDQTPTNLRASGKKASPSKKKGAKSIFDFIGDEKKKTDEDDKMVSGKDREAAGLDEYEDSTEQIDKRSGISLFKIIERRYMQSAYPIFFKEKANSKAKKDK
jgi:hypothetical protein